MEASVFSSHRFNTSWNTVASEMGLDCCSWCRMGTGTKTLTKTPGFGWKAWLKMPQRRLKSLWPGLWGYCGDLLGTVSWIFSCVPHSQALWLNSQGPTEGRMAGSETPWLSLTALTKGAGTMGPKGNWAQGTGMCCGSTQACSSDRKHGEKGSRLPDPACLWKRIQEGN